MSNVSENKYKNPKGNVLFLVILVMLTASMMGLLTMNVLKQMFSYTIDLDGYYNSYYVAKAGLELALTEIDNSGVGFSNTVTGGFSVFKDNFSCGENCGIDLQIKGRSSYLNENFWESTGCNDENAFVLRGGESFVLPLFYQNNTLNNRDIIGGQSTVKSVLSKLSSIKIKTPEAFDAGSVNMGIVFENEEYQRQNIYVSSYDLSNSDIISYYVNEFNSQYSPSLETDSRGNTYFVIMNPNNIDVRFCLSSNNTELSATKYFIVSLGNYRGRYVGLQAIYAQPIPKFMLN